MKAYDFTLKYRLGNLSENPEHYLSALAEAGCEDAAVGIGQKGRIALNFSRESESALLAITSAIENVQQAIPDAKLIEATPDFVSTTEIAELFGVSRQYIRQLIQSASTSFPEPVHEGKPSLWHLVDVLIWFQHNQSKAIDAEIYEVSKINMQLNTFKSCIKASATFKDFQFAAQAPGHLQETLCLVARA